MCKERGLPSVGLKDELIKLLVENDENAVAVVVSKHPSRVIANRNLIILVQQIVNNKDHPTRNYWNTAGSKFEQCERLCSLEKGMVAGIIRSTPGSNINAVDEEWGDLNTVEKAKKAARTFFKAMVDGSAKHRPATDDEIRRATDTLQLPAQVEEQPRPNASCITPVPARHSSNQGHGQAQVASTLDEAPNAEGNSSQAKVSDRDLLHAINTGFQTQRETNEVYRVQFSQQNEQIAGLLQTQNLQGATIAQQGQEITANRATLVQQGQRISATEVAQAIQTKVSAEAIGMAQKALLTVQKVSKGNKGLLGRNSDPLQRTGTGNLFDSPPTRSNGTDIGE
eukprot:scaffold32223_cov67-Skeletonema_dohrnii-CCMP3373.AAC.1